MMAGEVMSTAMAGRSAGGLPVRMRAAVLVGTGDLHVEERATPTAGPGEVLVQVRSVGVCGSDVHYYQHGRIGDFVVTTPLVLGHETGGVIVAAGAGVAPGRIGERVAVEPQVPCRRCGACHSGHYNLCRAVRFLGTPPVDGSFTEFLCVPEDFAFPVGAALGDDEAALCEPLAVGVWACLRAEVGVGDRVLVTGAGPVGLLATQVARAKGATVIMSEPDPDRRELAAALGASAVHDPATGPPVASGIAADVLLECSGVRGAAEAGVRCLGPGGRAVLVGMGSDEVILPIALLQTREIVLTGSFRYANCYTSAIALVQQGMVQLGPLVGPHFSLERTEEALLASRRDPRVIKAFVCPSLAS